MVGSLVRRLIRFLRRKTASLILRVLLLLMHVSGFRFLSVVFSIAVWLSLVRLDVAQIWVATLQRAGRPNGAVAWIEKVAARWPDPRLVVVQAEALMVARRYDEVAQVLGEFKRRHLTRRRTPFSTILEIEAMMALERDEIPVEAVAFAVGRSAAISDYCYQRAWDTHSVFDVAGVRRWLRYYFRTIDYDPVATFHACDELMSPNNLWDDMIGVLEVVERRLEESEELSRTIEFQRKAGGGEVSLRSRNSSRVRQGVHLRLIRAYLQTGRFDLAEKYLAKQRRQTAKTNHLRGLLYLYYGGEKELAPGGGGEKEAAIGREYLALAYGDKHSTKEERRELAGELAIAYEEAGDYASARQFYSSSYIIAGVPFFLPEDTWRYVSMCMALGDHEEAALLMRAGVEVLWRSFRSMETAPIEARLRKPRLTPDNDVFLVGCWGIGDDIVRIAMLLALRGDDAGGRFGLSVDPRMQSLYERSLPNFEIVPVSRMRGPFAVSEAEYVRRREGVPLALDKGRVDWATLKAAERFRNVALTEDIMVDFVAAGAAPRRPDAPMFKPLAEKVEAARAWLAALPPGLNVGISWRSGTRTAIRMKSYTDLVADWGPVLTIKGVNFINLQYSWEESELQEAEQRHGCVIHRPPFDLKDDIEDIVALASELDLVIAPGTTVREMCAATGTPVWSLSTTPFLPDLWRFIGDTRQDRLFPSMTHFAAVDYQNGSGALAEVARRLTQMAAAPHLKSASAE